MGLLGAVGNNVKHRFHHHNVNLDTANLKNTVPICLNFCMLINHISMGNLIFVLCHKSIMTNQKFKNDLTK